MCGIKPATAEGDGVTVFVEGPYGEATVDADMMLLATGRRPNSDLLNVQATGVTVNARALVVVDDYQETVVPGIYALGDISSPYALKHVANHEARVVRHNLMHPDQRVKHRSPVRPGRGVHRTADRRRRTDRGAGAAARDRLRRRAAATTAAPRRAGRGRTPPDSSRCSPIPATGLLLGAHVIGPEAATVIQPLIQAMSFGQRAHDVARGQYWIHPALSEVVENALLAAAPADRLTRIRTSRRGRVGVGRLGRLALPR